MNLIDCLWLSVKEAGKIVGFFFPIKVERIALVTYNSIENF